MLHPQAEAAIALWSQGPSVTDAGFGPAEIAEQRQLARDAAAAEPREPVAHVEEVDADGVPCRLYRPEGATVVVVFAHGGGFVFGDLDTHDGQSRRIANRTGMAVLAVDYRRPPEHRFPAAPDDVDTVVTDDAIWSNVAERPRQTFRALHRVHDAVGIRSLHPGQRLAQSAAGESLHPTQDIPVIREEYRQDRSLEYLA